MDEVLRKDAIRLIASGYRSLNNLNPIAADYHAELMVDEIEQSRICRFCGGSIQDDADRSTISQNRRTSQS